MAEADRPYAHWPEALRLDIVKNRFNGNVGSKLVSETDRVRVWHINLQPGERTHFHRHVLDYFWTCHSKGSARSYSEDGQLLKTEYEPGDTKHMSYAEGEYYLHAIENTGSKELVFTTVEFKYSENRPLDI